MYIVFNWTKAKDWLPEELSARIHTSLPVLPPPFPPHNFQPLLPRQVLV